MPRFQKRRSLASKFRKKYGRKKKRSFRSKLLDKKINTAVEVACVRIAQSEISKNEVNLIFRQYLFGAHNMFTNAFTLGTRIDYVGLVVPIATIQKMDNASAVQVPPAAFPEQTPATWQNPGVNVVAMTKPMDGFRQATTIKVHGISVGIRAWLPKQPDADPGLLKRVTIYWRISAVNEQNMQVVGYKPLPQNLMPMPRWGFSPKLDPLEAALTTQFKARAVATGKLTLNFNEIATTLSKRETYINLKSNPIKVIYADLDQNGQEIVHNNLFLTLRSTAPFGAGFAPYQPTVNVYTKLHYVDT